MTDPITPAECTCGAGQHATLHRGGCDLTNREALARLFRDAREPVYTPGQQAPVGAVDRAFADAALAVTTPTPAGDDQQEALDGLAHLYALATNGCSCCSTADAETDAARDAVAAALASYADAVRNTRPELAADLDRAWPAARSPVPTVNGLNVQDWFDIAVAKEQVNDALYTRVAELEASAPVTTEQVAAMARGLYVAVYGTRAADQFPDAVQAVGGRLAGIALAALGIKVTA